MQQLLFRKAAVMHFDRAQLQPTMFMSALLAVSIHDDNSGRTSDCSRHAYMFSRGLLRMLNVKAMLNSKSFGCHEKAP